MRIRITLLFILLALLIGLIFAQTNYAHQKLAHWIEKKTEGTLKIGKIKGVVPFWAHLSDVHYKTETAEMSFDEMKVALMPLSLIYGKLTIVDLSIHLANIQSRSQEWPRFSIPIDIHSFRIENLNYNSLKELQLSGRAELQKDFYLKVSLFHPKLPDTLSMSLQGDHQNHQVHTLAQLKQSGADGFVHLSGTYRWDAASLLGSWYAHKEGLKLKGALEVDLKEQKMMATGKALDRPFVVRADLKAMPGQVAFQYGDHQWKITAKYDLMNQLLSYHLHAHDITWKKIFVPHMTMDGLYKLDTLSFSLFLPEFHVLDPAYEVFPPVKLHIDGNINEHKVMARGLIEGLCERPFNLDLELPLHLSFSQLKVDIDEETPFFMRLCGCGSIDPILAFLENASLIAKGQVDIDLAVSGTWKTPEISGHLNYTHGQIESFATGALFDNIHVEMEGEGQGLHIRTLSACDRKGGNLMGTGQIVWDPDQSFPLEFHVLASHYQILGVDPLTLTVDADILLSGNTRGILISGGASVVEGRLSIPSDLPVQVPCVDVCYINPILTPSPEEILPRKIIPVYWDLNLRAKNNFYIDGRGINSVWNGNLHITGEQKDFQFDGKLRLIQGRIDIINRTFSLVHGRVQIQGLDPHMIFVDLKGDYELPNLTASILMTGSLDSTRISFCSNPPMNTNQILSWILFQEDINELTPMQACRLASILVSLSGKYSGPKTFDKIKDKLGIDVFSITDCDIDSADLTFQVGKYLSQGTFVGVNKSISGDYDSVLIQTRLFRNFYLEADYGGSLNSLTPNGGKAILKWYKSY